MPNEVLATELAGYLRAGAPAGLCREANCFLATVSAAYLANRLAVAGFVVMRRDESPQLDL